jgi:hypothetical protein
MEALYRVDFVQLFGRQAQCRAVSAVLIVVVRDQGIEAIVPAGELDDYEYCVTFFAPRRGGHY